MKAVYKFRLYGIDNQYDMTENERELYHMGLEALDSMQAYHDREMAKFLRLSRAAIDEIRMRYEEL